MKRTYRKPALKQLATAELMYPIYNQSTDQQLGKPEVIEDEEDYSQPNTRSVWDE